EQVGLYERRAKFELTEREQKINEQLRVVILDRNFKEETLKRELHSTKLQLTSTINRNKSMVEETTFLKQDFKQKENKLLAYFLNMKSLKEKVEDRLVKQNQSLQTVHMLCKPRPLYNDLNKKQLTPEQIYWSNDLVKLKSEALKERAKVSRPIKAFTVNNRDAHLDYLRHLKESVETIRDIVEEATVTNIPVPHSTGVKRGPKASESQPKSNHKTNRISPTKSANKLSVEDLPRTNKSHPRTTNRVDSSSHLTHTAINSNSNSICQTCNKCLTSFDHDMCVDVYVKSIMLPHSTRHNCEVERRIQKVWKPKHIARKMTQVWKPKLVGKVWKPTGKVLTTIGHQWRPTDRILHLGTQCPLTRFTPPQVVVQIVLWYLDLGCSKHMTGDRSRLLNFVKKFIGTARFRNDHFGAFMSYGDYVVGESVIFRGIQKALTREVKQMKDVLEELEAEVAQCVVERKHDAIDRKNLLIANDNLIAECLSKEVFSVVTKSELNVARFAEMHVANTSVESRYLAFEAELATLRDKSHQENQGELIKHFSKLEVDHLNLQLKYQNLKDIIRNHPPTTDKDTSDFDSVFVIGKMQASLLGKDNVIR
nr:integrase, catalytic region, zinc finger, CCHC-type, peptidase aspartic, catalytic [Tanacetum cinerariifolium]